MAVKVSRRPTFSLGARTHLEETSERCLMACRPPRARASATRDDLSIKASSASDPQKWLHGETSDVPG